MFSWPGKEFMDCASALNYIQGRAVPLLDGIREK